MIETNIDSFLWVVTSGDLGCDLQRFGSRLFRDQIRTIWVAIRGYVPCSLFLLIIGQPSVSTFLYGAAHHHRRSLDSVRRELGYFKPNAVGNQWVDGPQSETLQLNPDEGPPRAVPKKGLIVVGATEWVDNYNVPIFTSDMAMVRKIAKMVSGRGGKFPSVQSMALAHGKGVIEVACNLLDTSKVGGDKVQREVERLAREEGMDVGEGYYTDLSQGVLIENYLKLAHRSTTH